MIRRPPRSTQSRSSQRQMCIRDRGGVGLAGRLPALFIGHDSSMNIVADNGYTRDLEALAAHLPRPAAILVVSAHWLTQGTAVGADEHNLTIYDFFGFPDELYEKKYPAPGSPAVAARVRALTGGRAAPVERGLDHAAWAPLIRMYPAADVPVIELSLDVSAPAAEHYALGRSLAPLRDEGVLIVGSGNIVHLSLIHISEPTRLGM